MSGGEVMAARRGAGGVLLSALAISGCAGSAVTAKVGERPWRASLALRQEFGIASGRDVCGKEAQLTGGFACFREDGLQYHGTPLPERTPSPTRLEVGTTRLLGGLDYLVLENLAVGVRAGVVLRGLGPRQDGATAPAPLLFHGEVRAAYWFGAAPPAREGLRWGVFLAGGTAQVDTAWRSRVEEDTSQPRPVVQPHNPPAQTLDVYRKSGTGFAGGGVTAAFSFLERSAVFVEVMGMQLFPSEGTALSPVLGYEHAF